MHRYDWVLLGSALGLSALGLISLFSTTQPELSQFFKQIAWVVFGIILFIIFSSLDYRLFRAHFSPVVFLYGLAIAGLLLVAFFSSPVRGAQSWLALGPINIEPVEPLKVILILILAKYFSMRHVEMYRIKHIVVSGIYILIPSALVLLQPDLGSFLILGLIWAGIIIISGVKIKHLFALALLSALVSVLAWSFFLADYQKDRITSFLNPEYDPYGSGYNSIQSVVAVGSGGFWGKGLQQGTQTQLGFLPEAHTDFAYASIAEELGIIATIMIIFLFSALFWRLMKMTHAVGDNFARMYLAGLIIMIASQSILNIAMALGLLPIAGLPLPFVSYGGSSIMTLFIALGIAQNIYKNRGIGSVPAFSA